MPARLLSAQSSLVTDLERRWQCSRIRTKSPAAVGATRRVTGGATGSLNLVPRLLETLKRQRSLVSVTVPRSVPAGDRANAPFNPLPLRRTERHCPKTNAVRVLGRALGSDGGGSVERERRER